MDASSCGKKRARVIIGATFLTLAAVLLIWATDQVVDTGTFVARNYQVLGELDTIQFLLKEDDAAELGFVATGDQDYLKPTEKIRDKMYDIHRRLDNLFGIEWKLADGDQRKAIPNEKIKLAEALEKLVGERLNYTKSIVAVAAGDGAASLDAARYKIARDGNGKVLSEQIDARIKELRSMHEGPLSERLKSVNRSAEELGDVVVIIHFAYVSFVVLGLLVILVGGACRWQWVRNLWFRSIHLTMILIVAVEAVVGIQCPLTGWEADLKAAAGKEVQEGGFIARWMHQVVIRDDTSWKDNQWVFEIIYLCVFGLVLASLWIVPPCRRKKSTCAPAPPGPGRLEETAGANVVKT